MSPTINNQDMIAFSQLNAQINSLASQRNHIKMMVETTKKTIEELEASEEKTAYKNLGFVLLKCDKSKLIKDLKSEIESLELREKTIQKTEETLTKKMEELKIKLDAQMNAHNPEGHNHNHEQEHEAEEEQEEPKKKKN